MKRGRRQWRPPVAAAQQAMYGSSPSGPPELMAADSAADPNPKAFRAKAPAGHRAGQNCTLQADWIVGLTG